MVFFGPVALTADFRGKAHLCILLWQSVSCQQDQPAACFYLPCLQREPTTFQCQGVYIYLCVEGVFVWMGLCVRDRMSKKLSVLQCNYLVMAHSTSDRDIIWDKLWILIYVWKKGMELIDI